MFSLTVIFINVIVAANEVPDEHEDSVAVILVILNVIVLLIIVGKDDNVADIRSDVNIDFGFVSHVGQLVYI